MRVIGLAFMWVFAAALAAGLAAGCAKKSAPEKRAAAPAWVTGASGYSSAYLSGTGSGASQQVASDRARSDLAKTISVSVESVEQSRKSATLTTYDSSFSSAVFTRASRTIEGVEIADRYYDEKNDIHYALAILDKNSAASRLRGEIAEAQLEIDSLLALSDRQSAIKKLKLLNKAEKLLNERRASAAVLSVIAGGSAAPYISESSITAKKIEAISAVKFSVSGDNEGKKLLAETLSALGFTIAGGGLDAVGSYESAVREERGWQWAKAAIDIRIADNQTGEVVGAYRFEAEETAQNADTAKERALKALRSRLNEELIDKIAN